MSANEESLFWKDFKVIGDSHWVTESFKVKGDIEFNGIFRFIGSVEGSITSRDPSAHLFVLEGARIKGNIEVDSITVVGELKDVNLRARFFRALPGARVHGRVFAKLMQIEEGALVEGTLGTIESI